MLSVSRQSDASFLPRSFWGRSLEKRMFWTGHTSNFGHREKFSGCAGSIRLLGFGPCCGKLCAMAFLKFQSLAPGILFFWGFMDQTIADRSPQDMLRSAFQLFDGGKVPEALRLAKTLHQSHPNHPDVLHLLGLIALKGGVPANAEKFIRLALALAPDKVFFHVNLANALRQQGKNAEARKAYDKAVTYDPLFPGIYVNRGTLNAEEGLSEEAQRDFEKLIDLNPDQPEGYLRLGRLYSELGQFARAVQTYRAGLEARPGGAMLLLGLAEALERAGDLDEAVATAEKTLEALPDHPGALGIWARAKRRQGHLVEARDRLERVEVAKLPPELRRIIHGELGQIYDRLGDVADAFGHFTAQNSAATNILEPMNIDRQTYMAQVQELKTAFTPAWVASWGKVAPADLCDIPAPVFLVGFPRSGTTLLDQFLDAHDGIEVVEEQPVLLPVRDALKREGGYPQALEGLDVRRINELRTLYLEALKKVGADPQGKIVVNKLPLNIIHAGLIARIFPEARFILALRHPADAVLSCFMQDFQLNASMAHFLTLKDSAALYEAVMSLWTQVRALVPLSVAEVRYEELIEDPQRALGDVLPLLGLGWQPSQGDHAAHARARGTIRTPSYSQVTEPLYTRAAGRWLRYESQLDGVLPRLEPFIREFGYE